jgi:hypothetical protein
MCVSNGLGDLSRVFRDIVGRDFIIAGHIRSARERGQRRAVSVQGTREVLI